MILNVTCPHCGALLDVDPAWLGQPMECGGCGSVFPCPEIAEEAPPDDAPKVLREKSSRRSKRERDDYDRWDGYEEYDQEEDPDSHIAKKRGPGYATASLVIGIVSLVVVSPLTFITCGFGGFVQIILSIVGLILGYIGLRSDYRVNAIVGMVLNALCLIFAVLWASFMGAVFSTGPLFGAAPATAPTKTVSTWKSGAMQPQPAPPNKMK